MDFGGNERTFSFQRIVILSLDGPIRGIPADRFGEAMRDMQCAVLQLCKPDLKPCPLGRDVSHHLPAPFTPMLTVVRHMRIDRRQ
jgi:hypothetical protein